MPLFQNIVAKSGRHFSQCLDCKGWCPPEREGEHKCPRDLSGQMWSREVWRDPYGEKFTCPGCGERTEQLSRVRDHWCLGAAAVAAFAGQLEEAIEQARLEGSLHALETAANIADAESNRYAATWGEGSAGDKALLRVAEEIRKRMGERA